MPFKPSAFASRTFCVCFSLCLFLTATISLAGLRSATTPLDDKKIDKVATRLNPAGNNNAILVTAFHNATYSPDGKTLAIGRGTGEILMWDVEQRKLMQNVKAHDNWTFSIAFDKTGKKLFTAGGDDLVKVWDLSDMSAPLKTLKGHTGDVHALGLSSDETQLVSAGDDMVPLIWNLESEKVVKKLDAHPRQIPALAISPDGKRIATSSRDSNLRVFDFEGTLIQSIDKHEKDIITVRYSHDGQLIAAADYSGNIGIWDADMGYPFFFDKCTSGSMVCVDFSSDSKTVAAVDNAHLFLVAADGKQKPKRLTLDRLDNEQFSFVRFHPTKNRLTITTTLSRILQVDLDNDQVFILTENQEPVQSKVLRRDEVNSDELKIDHR